MTFFAIRTTFLPSPKRLYFLISLSMSQQASQKTTGTKLGGETWWMGVT